LFFQWNFQESSVLNSYGNSPNTLRQFPNKYYYNSKMAHGISLSNYLPGMALVNMVSVIISTNIYV